MADEKTPPLTPPSAPDEIAFQEPTWEDDETQATGIMRALFVCLSGALLLVTQWSTPETWTATIAQNWSRWVGVSVVCNFVLPIGLIWLFFGQGLVHQDWLKDQRHNAWNYGWNFGAWKKHVKIALILWVVMLPFIIYFAQNPATRASYADYLPTPTGISGWVFLLGSLAVYMFCWEWFFRGFALFGVAQGFGPIAAITIQAVAFGLAHVGKPPAEMYSAFAGGAILGVVCWREKSFFPAFLIHAFVHVSFALFVLSKPIPLPF